MVSVVSEPIMLRVMLNVIMLRVMLNVIMMSVFMMSVFMLSVIMLSVIMLSVILPSVILLSVIMPNVIIRSVIMLSVIMLNVIMPSVVAPTALQSYHFPPHWHRGKVKLECFVQASLIFEATRVEQLSAHPSEGWLLTLPSNIRLAWKKVDRDKRTSLLCRGVIDAGKGFRVLTPEKLLIVDA